MEGIRFEDVGESFPFAGGDDRPVAGLHDGPDRMLAARSAAEVAPDHQHGRTAKGRVVERELGILRTMAVRFVDLGSGPRGVPLVGEEQGTEARPLDPLQVARGDDQIGVDVGPVQDGQAASCDTKGCMVIRVRFGVQLRPISARNSQLEQLADVSEVAGDGGGGGHGRADEVGASAGTLAALEVTITGAGGSLAGRELVGIHGQAHAASRLPPFGAGLEENAVEALGFGLVAHLLAAGDDQGTDAGGRLPTAEDPGRGAEIFDPAIGAGADENDVDRDLADRRTGAGPCRRGRGGRPRGR